MLKKLISIFRKSKPDQLYMDMRNQAFYLDPEKIRIVRKKGQNVWGIITEFGMSDGYASIVSLASGTTNMYFSSGSGVLGAGDYTKVQQAAGNLISIAEKHISMMSPAKEFPLPSTGYIRFYLLTYNGIYTTEIPETIPYEEITHPMYGLYAYSHNVIRQIRIVTGAENPK